MRGATRFLREVFTIVDANGVHGVDPKCWQAAVAQEDTEIFPMLNDYDVVAGQWNGDAIGEMMENPAARKSLHLQLDKFLYANPNYHGICLDFEQVPE